MSLKLNLGSGKNKLEGYINIDGNPKAKPNIVHDLAEDLPFKDNSIDEIRARHVLEHLKAPVFFKVMKEAHRVLKEGGMFKIRVPYYKSPNMYSHPFHVRIFTEDSFLFFADTKYRWSANLEKEIPCFSKVNITLTGGCFGLIPKLVPLISWKRGFGFLYDEVKAELTK